MEVLIHDPEALVTMTPPFIELSVLSPPAAVQIDPRQLTLVKETKFAPLGAGMAVLTHDPEALVTIKLSVLVPP
jgi:hypothetical protein